MAQKRIAKELAVRYRDAGLIERFLAPLGESAGRKVGLPPLWPQVARRHTCRTRHWTGRPFSCPLIAFPRQWASPRC